MCVAKTEGGTMMAQITRIDPQNRQSKGKIRVAAYCRVSSGSADQLNSYARQISVYRALIESRTDWTLVEIFADEGVTGTSVDKRTEFLRMIKMCELRMIDLIVTKSVSRFARNVKEALEYVRKLKLLGVGVMFEKEGINTQSMADEMLLNTFAALAQEESMAISQNLKLANKKRMASGEYNIAAAPFGFRRIDKKLVPYEPEAETVRMMYDWYLEGKSTYGIADELNRRGITTKCSTHNWTHNRVAKILCNEKNVGDSMLQKFYTTDFPFKRVKNRGEEDRYYSLDTHEAIVSREVFEAARDLLRKRAEKSAWKTEMRSYPFTGKLRCTLCGSVLSRKVINGCERWCCLKHIEHSKACDAHYVQTDRIEDGFITMVNNLRFGGNLLATVEGQIVHAIQQYKANDDDTVQASRAIAELNGQLLMLEQLFGKGYLASDVYQSRSQEIANKLSELKNTKSLSVCIRLEETLKNIRALKSKIEAVEDPVTAFDPQLFGDIVLSGTFSENDELTLEFIGGLKFTEQI